LQFSQCYRFLTPDIAGDHLEENDMRNVLVSALMISLYALSSTMDFVDAERLHAQHPVVKTYAACDPTIKYCPGAKEQLALNSH
jgi:hypothetical protein